jgi:hypothetical protein
MSQPTFQQKNEEIKTDNIIFSVQFRQIITHADQNSIQNSQNNSRKIKSKMSLFMHVSDIP